MRTGHRQTNKQAELVAQLKRENQRLHERIDHLRPALQGLIVELSAARRELNRLRAHHARN